jgi:hypothetical protein
MARNNSKTPDSAIELPDPYGHGFERIEDPLEKTRIQWNHLETRRKLFGSIARNWMLIYWRSIVGLVLAFTAMLGILFPDQISEKNWLIILLPIPVLLAVIPNIIAVESAWHAMQAKLSLREQGGLSDGVRHTLRVQPGIDRIIDGLRDHRRSNLVSAVLISIAFSMILLATATKPGTVAWNLALLVSTSTGFIYTFHAQYTNLNVKQLGDRFPNLVFHAPTHHQTQLGSILSDLLSAHLDPDLELEWNNWKTELHNSLMPGNDKKQALERLLYLLYLHNLGEITDADVRKEFSTFIIKGKLEAILYNQDSDFNWRTLQRLISHANAWQPSAFNLLDRLQIDLLSGKPEISRSKWRMDVALDDLCVGGATNLFIVLNNQTFEKRNVTVEVLVPNGEPETRTHRFELDACPPPRNALKLSATNDEDCLDWIPRYLHKGVVLWMNVAWNRNFYGRTNIQVVLRDEAGIVLESKVLTTEVSRKTSNALRKRMLRFEKAREIGEMDIPIAG